MEIVMEMGMAIVMEIGDELKIAVVMATEIAVGWGYGDGDGDDDGDGLFRERDNI